MACSCFEGTPCELERELLEKVKEALHRWENFQDPSSEVAVAQAEQPLFEHRRAVQHAIYSALLVASDEFSDAEKEFQKYEAKGKLDALQELYIAAKLATREVAPWTRAERMTTPTGTP